MEINQHTPIKNFYEIDYFVPNTQKWEMIFSFHTLEDATEIIEYYTKSKSPYKLRLAECTKTIIKEINS